MTRMGKWYFDLISPFAYLSLAQFDQLPSDFVVEPTPVLFAGLLAHWEQKGPAEIPAKRLHTYRQCIWIAGTLGIPFRMPPAHPFNPLAALRLLCALGPTIEQTRIASHFVFGLGRDPSDPRELQALGSMLDVLDVSLALEKADKGKLRKNTEDAAARGAWGVPTFDVGGELFWGADSVPMLLQFLKEPALFTEGEMARAACLPIGAMRKL